MHMANMYIDKKIIKDSKNV